MLRGCLMLADPDRSITPVEPGADDLDRVLRRSAMPAVLRRRVLAVASRTTLRAFAAMSWPVFLRALVVHCPMVHGEGRSPRSFGDRTKAAFETARAEAAQMMYEFARTRPVNPETLRKRPVASADRDADGDAPLHPVSASARAWVKAAELLEAAGKRKVALGDLEAVLEAARRV